MRNLFDKISQRLPQISWVGVDVDAVSCSSQIIFPPKLTIRSIFFGTIFFFGSHGSLRIKNYAHQNIMNFSLSAFVLGLKMMSHKLCEGTQLWHISLVPPCFYIGQMECLADRLNMVCCRLRRWAKYCPQSRLEQLAQLSACLWGNQNEVFYHFRLTLMIFFWK